jgi:hypothetical protein
VSTNLCHFQVSDEFLKVLSRIFFIIGTILQDSPTLVPVLRPQLPRAVWLRTLVDLSSLATDNQLPPVQDVWGPDLPCWQLFRSIEDACILRDDCTRRGCDRKCIAKCKTCKRAGYCGVNCQARCAEFWVSAILILKANRIYLTATGKSIRRYAN